MQTIALAAWQGGDTRVASEQRFREAVKTAQAEVAWENFEADNGPDVANLAMNFYLKAAEAGHRGFEFTHKSFGDYLAARAILDFAQSLHFFIDRKVDHALTDWIAAMGSGKLTMELLTFLRNEVRLRATDDLKEFDSIVRLKVAFERFVGTILSDGLPACVGAPSWRVAELRQMNAETMAWAVLNAFAVALASVDHPKRFVEIRWTDSDSLRQLVNRISLEETWGCVGLQCFSYLVAPNMDLSGLFMPSINFHGARLPGSDFTACWLFAADFRKANLEGCAFRRATLDYAKLHGATLEDSDLSGARFDIETTSRRMEDGPDGGTDRVHSEINLTNAFISAETLLYADLDYFSSIIGKLRRWRSQSNLAEGRHLLSRIKQIGRLISVTKVFEENEEQK